MRRPLLLRALPDRLRVSVAARFYRPVPPRLAPLYGAATLAFAPRLTMELVPGDLVSDGIALTGIHELGLSRHLARLGRRGGLMVDVGANLGYFSLLWAAAAPGNRCVALEPSPRNVAILRRNVARNGLDAAIDVRALAAGAVAGMRPFDPGPAEQTGWGGLAPAPAPGTVQVEVAAIDDLGVTGRVALLKIDTEGADTWVLRGCRRLLAAKAIDEIWYEQNLPRMRVLGIGAGEAADLLSSCGYVARPAGAASGDVTQWRAVPAT